MRLLIISFYYPPDLSAGSFRMEALIKALKDLKLSDLTVDVITTQPNRYADLAQTVDPIEDHGWLRVRRLHLPSHQSGMKDQAKAFAGFAKGVWAVTKDDQWDMVFATSSRLMTAVLGAAVARRLAVPLYLDIRDLFSDTMADVLKSHLARHSLPLFKRLEKWTFRRAARINIVSEGFASYMRQSIPAQTLRNFSNGIDPIFLQTDFTRAIPSSKCHMVYAGNLGEGQGLHRIVPQAMQSLGTGITMTVIGAGGQAHLLKQACNGLEAATQVAIHLRPPVPRQDLLNHYKDADILFLHLNDYDAFRKVLPSKIFEYAATGKPIVAGVAGYAAQFLKTHVPGAIVFDPCDVDGMIQAVQSACRLPTPVDRHAFCTQFARSKIMADMARDVIQLMQSSHS